MVSAFRLMPLILTFVGQPDQKEQARHFLDLCKAEKFTEATSNFDATMKQAMPADKLAEVWKGLIKQLGPLENMGAPRTDKIKTSTRVKIRCDFKTIPLDSIVSFNAGGQIEGFFLVPAERPADSPAPPYVDA